MMINFDYLFPKYGIKPDGVIHLGANTGQEAETYKKHDIDNVIWVEAIPSVYEELLAHLKAVGCEHHKCINACVGDEDGKIVEFKISNNEAQSSSYLDLGHHKIIHPTVKYVSTLEMQMQRGDTIFKDVDFSGKWFLNADLQGSELQAFKGMGNLMSKFDWVYSEVNFKECYIGGALVGELDDYLSTFGFKRVETGTIVGETWTDALYIIS